MPDEAPALAAPRARRLQSARDSRFGPAFQALLVGLALGAVKVAADYYDLEPLVVGLPVLTALLGAVVFTLAIVLAGVLQDFKEAERGLGELVSQVRRLYWDFGFSGADAPTLAKLRAELRHFVNMVRENAQHGFRWRLRDLHTPIDNMDRLLTQNVKSPWPTSRTAQTGLGALTRLVDRLEVIVETTFMQAGYTFAAASIGVVLACFLMAPLGSMFVGATLVGAVGFVLVGLYLLVRDLDNPMAGSVRISLSQVEKLASFLAEREAGTA